MIGSLVLKERGACRGYLEEQKGSVEDGGRAGDVKDELLQAREGRQYGVTKVLKANISVGLNEQDPLTCAVDGEPASILLSEPSSKRVVGHKGFGESLLYNPHGVLAAHGLVPPVEIEVGDLDPHTILLIKI